MQFTYINIERQQFIWDETGNLFVALGQDLILFKLPATDIDRLT